MQLNRIFARGTLFLLCLSFITSSLQAQSYGIKIDVDEFTGDSMMISDWVKLNDPVWKSGKIAYLRFAKLAPENIVLQLKVVTSDVTSVNKGDEFLIKLANDEVLKFESLEYVITGHGDGATGLRASNALGMDIVFQTDIEAVTEMSMHKVVKARLKTSNGFIEIEPEKEKYKDELLSYAKLFSHLAGLYLVE